MRRRTLIPLCLVPAASLGLVACGSAVPEGQEGDSGDGGEVTVTVMSNFTSDVARGQVLDELIAKFNEDHEGEYQVESAAEPDWPTLQQKIRSMISAGDPPDVFLYNYNPNDRSREESGALMDWSRYLDEDPEWKARFSPANLDAIALDGAIPGIPGDQAPALVYYHSDLLEQAGHDSFPATWDDFFTVAETLKSEGVAGLAMMTADDAWHTMNAFSYLATAAGGRDAYAPGESLDSDAIRRAAEDTRRLLELSTPDAVGGNYAVSSRNFLAKQALAVIDGPWLISSIQSDVEDPCTVQVAPAPTAGDGAVEPGYTVTDSLNVWGAAEQADEEKTEAVVAWMKYFTSNDSAVRMAVDGEYPLAVQTELGPEDAERASCQMRQVLEIANAAPASVVQMGREITSGAQAQLPSLLESLALGQRGPDEFAAGLQQANQE
ncbi:ABC transporter substrate-binding protein [Jiangella asiatica]|uniref:Extracellular solute-binding protein n=1 Tax=Jiangella asiatica TaxID=2530372 RepID=A0A4R5D5U3_9ACTN|nr:extracellular solute-binding protein [Jiangella asiatica]TDE07917.1 extracellular solute-binding protein [Jiangella asiatica]